MRQLIAVVLVSGTLVGCGSGEGSSTSSPEGATPAAAMSSVLVAIPATAEPGEPVRFSDPGVDGAVSWNWDFGDGVRSDERSPLHIYAQSGQYEVKVVVNRGSVSVSRSLSLTVGSEAAAVSASADIESATMGAAQAVTCLTRRCDAVGSNTPPTASFKALPFGSAVGTPVQFTDTSVVSPTSWAWDFGDGTTSKARSPLHTYGRPGAYVVSLTSSNAAGSSVRRSAYRVTVAGLPPSPAIGVFPAGGVINASVKFTDQSTSGPTAWSWNFGDGGTSTEANPEHKYTSAGTYTVTLKVSNAIGTKSGAIAYSVDGAGAPKPSFTSWPDSASVGMPVHFDDASKGGPVAWRWSFGDGSTSDESSPVHTYSRPGFYRVAMKVTSANAESALVYKIVKVVAGKLPVALFSVSPMGSTAAGESVWFKDDSVGSPTSWSWEFGDGAVSTLQHPSHAYARAGQYTVSLKVTDKDGATQTLSRGRTVLDKVGTPPADWTQQWLSTFATVRAGQLGGVPVVPEPRPALDPFTWSDASAQVAQGWADQCYYAHNQNRDRDGSGAIFLRGESVWASPSSLSGDVPASKIVAVWGSEYQYYNYASRTCQAGKVCGHYLTLVYRNTTQVGCSRPTSCAVLPSETPLPFRFSESYVKGGFTTSTCNYTPPYDSAGRPY